MTETTGKRAALLKGFAFALVLAAPPAGAQNAFDHFATLGPIAGQTSGVGWGGAWTGTGTVVNSTVTTVCNGQPPSGNALGPASGSGATRPLKTAITGNKGTSVILSSVVSSDVNGNTSSLAALGNSSGGTFAIGDLKNTTWSLQNSAGVYPSSKPVVANAATCLVAQIDFSVSPGLDRMRLWINPQYPLSLAQAADIDVTTAHITTFSGISWQTLNGSQALDEVGVNFAGGKWVPLKHQYPGGGIPSGESLLLTDGSILVREGLSFHKLTPDILGSYVDGTWNLVPLTPIPSGFNWNPWVPPSAVLQDGRVIFAGGEGSRPVVAIYDPVLDKWSRIAPPDFLSTAPFLGFPASGQSQACDINGNAGAGPTYKYWCSIGESPSSVLPDGSFMVGNGGGDLSLNLGKLEALLPPPYDPAINPWIQTGLSKHDGNSEGSFTLLPSPLGSSLVLGLTVDTYHGFGKGVPPTPICMGSSLAGNNAGGWQSSELYIKGTYAGAFLGINGPFPGDWNCLGDTVDQLWQGVPSVSSFDEIGPAMLRPDGTVAQFGASPYTGILGADFKWRDGPGFPKDGNGNQLIMSDAPAALLPNGNVLISTSACRETGYGCANSANPVVFFELTPDPSNVLVKLLEEPYASIRGSGYVQFLVLPTGEIWATPNRGNSDIEIYTPNNPTYDPAWAPAISSSCTPLCYISQTANVLFGQRFNGMSQAAAYGDELLSATNYPIVRLISGTNVYYMRTYGHSTMGVATGSTQVSTHFDVPSNVPTGTYCLEVVANGIPSPQLCNVQFLDSYVEVCKSSSPANPVTGNFTFTSSAFTTVPNNSVTVPVGACSGPIPVDAGDVVISEAFQTGFSLSGVTASGYNPTSFQLEDRLKSFSSNPSGATAVVKAVAGNSSVETVVTFTNQGPIGQLKICKIAGEGVAVGTSSSFTVTIPAAATGPALSRSYTVPAGPASQGGYCAIDSDPLPVGVKATVTEVLPASSVYIVTSTASPAGNKGGRSITVVIGAGFTQVTFTNSTFIVTCCAGKDGGVAWVAAAPGVAGSLSIPVTSTPGVEFIAAATVISGPAGWLSVSPTQATTPATLSLSAAALPVGTYSGKLTIATVDGATIVSVPVTYTVPAPTPVLSIVLTHQGNFTQGQNGAIYLIAVKNSGNLPTSGVVTVTALAPDSDPIPGDLILASMSGTGWSCSAYNCTRGDVLQPGFNYPPITLKVNVPANAPLELTASASVFGGGSVAATAQDLTKITQGPPSISLVANAAGENPAIAPNTWVEIKGVNLAPPASARTWQGSDFVNGRMPTQLDGVSATVNGKPAYVYYISPTQINILTPPDLAEGRAQLQLTNNGSSSAPIEVPVQTLSPSFFVFGGGPYVAATHADGSLLGPVDLFPGSSAPARLGETIVLYANGFGPTDVSVSAGSVAQSGKLSPLPLVTIGGTSASVSFAGLVAPGQYQFNVQVPASLSDGDQPITATYKGLTTQTGVVVTIKR